MKTLQQVVAEIKGFDVSKSESRRFAETEFAQLYAWIKADVVAHLLEEQRKNNIRIRKQFLKSKYNEKIKL